MRFFFVFDLECSCYNILCFNVHLNDSLLGEKLLLPLLHEFVKGGAQLDEGLHLRVLPGHAASGNLEQE